MREELPHFSFDALLYLSVDFITFHSFIMSLYIYHPVYISYLSFFYYGPLGGFPVDSLEVSHPGNEQIQTA